MLEIDTHNTCGPARAEKRHLPFAMRSFAALSSVGSAARESAREEDGRTPRQRPACPVDPQKSTPGCCQLQQPVVSAIARSCTCSKSAAKTLLQVEMPFAPGPAGPSRAAAPHARPREADQPSAAPAPSRSCRTQGPGGHPRGEHVAL
jgi:hypothetical protein